LNKVVVLDDEELDALLGWHLYECPPVDPSSHYKPNVFQHYIGSHNQDFMKHASLLQRQFLDISELLKYGPPRYPNTPQKYVDDSLCVPKWRTQEWEVVNIIEGIEKKQFQYVFDKFETARTVITSCQGIFNSLKRICELAMKKADLPGINYTGSTDFPLRGSNLPNQLLVSDGRDELIARLFGLKDWITYIQGFYPDTIDNMYHRSCAISDEFYGTYKPLPQGWTPDLTYLIPEPHYWYPRDVKRFERIYQYCMEYHSMRTVQLESLLHLTNALIFSWKILIDNHLSQLYRSSNVDANYNPNPEARNSWKPPPPKTKSIETTSKRRRSRMRRGRTAESNTATVQTGGPSAEASTSTATSTPAT
jgi:hypothetical protein